MGTPRERLDAVDRELSALGKSAGELAAVVARARALAASIEDVDAALSALGAGEEAALTRTFRAARAPASARAAFARSEPDTVLTESLERDLDSFLEGTSTDLGPPLPSDPAPEAPAGSDPPPGTSSIVGMSVDELFAADPSAPPEIPTGAGIDELFEDEARVIPTATSPGGALAGLFDDVVAPAADLFTSEPSPEAGASGLEDLFSDEPAQAPSQGEAAMGSLADLFEDEVEELRLSDPDLGTLEQILEPGSEQPRSEQPASEQPEGNEEASHGSAATADAAALEELAAGELASGEFELLVDEELLELEEEPDGEPPAQGPDETGGGARGLIRRILGRK